MNETARERFYDEVLAAVRRTLILSSGDTCTLPTTTFEDMQASIAAQSVTTPPPGHWEPVPPDEQVASWDGFQFVDIARLGTVALIAFRWRETGAEIFVHSVDLQECLDREMSVSMADTLISINLLERLGGGWHWLAPLRRIKGLTFIE